MQESLKDKKIALVLSGGIVKAASWHLGVALALEELGFVFRHNGSPRGHAPEISTYVGSSAGSLVGLYLASGYGPLDIIHATRKNRKDCLRAIGYRDMLSLKWSLRKAEASSFYDPFEGLPFLVRKMLAPIKNIAGLFTTEGLKRYVIENCLKGKIGFDEFEADIFVVATQLDHSDKSIFCKYRYPSPRHDPSAVYRNDISVAEGIAASMSVPPFYCPYPIRNPDGERTEYYIDGEIRDTLSTHVAVDNGCDVIISSWTHTPYHFQEAIGSLVNFGLPAICTQAIYLIIQKKILSARLQRKNAKDVIDTVHNYMIDHKFPVRHRKSIASILEQKLDFNPDIQLVDIYPDHDDYRAFFKNPFSLDPKGTQMLISAGYTKAKNVFSENNNMKE